MTFRQIVNTIWQRRIIVVAVVVLAILVAIVFLYRQPAAYTSSTTVRLSSLSTDAATSGQIGTAPVDFDPASVASPQVLTAAAKITGDSPSALGGQVTYTAGDQTQANRLTITVTGPTAASAQARADAVAKAYNTYLQGQLDTAKTAAQKQAEQATTNAETYQTQVNKNPANSIAQSNLASALKSLGDANATVDQITNSGPPLTVITAAGPGEFQGVSPLIALAIALVSGLVAGIGIALIRDQFDNRLRGEQEIEALTGTPSLGELSLDKRVARRKQRLPTADRKRTPLNEGLRALRTTLQVLLPPTGSVVVFTSVEPGDGKTFVSANLALAWARTGKSVVLVGGDLRRPGLGEYYDDAADGRGLTELLQSAADSGAAPSQADVEQTLQDTPFRGLRILPSGAEPYDPADLLAVSALATVFDSLRKISDIVVVDSPPSMALVDASLLAAQADGAVLVATVRRTNRDHLTETIHILNGNGVTVLGVVANRSRRRIPRSYGAYYGRKKSQRVAGVSSSRPAPVVERAAAAGSTVDPVQATVRQADLPLPKTTSDADSATVTEAPTRSAEIDEPRQRSGADDAV